MNTSMGKITTYMFFISIIGLYGCAPEDSNKDDEVMAAADKNGIAMVFTGKRHFKH